MSDLPDITITAGALQRLSAVLAEHPGKRIRIRHDGYG